MFFRLMLIFIIVPFIELVLLLRMAEATGWLTTLMIVVITGIIGSFLARREGLTALARFREAIAAGRMPSAEIRDGLMIVFAAALLLTPGLLTDGLGFVLLTPPGRNVISAYLVKRYGHRFQVQVSGFTRPERSTRTSNQRADTVDSPSFGPKQSSHQA